MYIQTEIQKKGGNTSGTLGEKIFEGVDGSSEIIKYARIPIAMRLMKNTPRDFGLMWEINFG